MSAARVDAVVVGGGLVGSAAAWQLARRGNEVVLLERFGPRHVHGASHGASRIFRRTYADPTYVALASEAETAWRELESQTGTSLLTPTGGLDHGSPAAVAGLVASLEATGQAHELLPAAEAAHRWPGLRFETDVLHSPGTGRLHADDAVAALQQAAGDAGAQVRHHVRVARIELATGDAVVHLEDGTSLRTAHLVVAAGAWTPVLLDGLVALPRITVTQEQPAHFRAGVPTDDWPAVVHHTRPGDDAPTDAYALATPGEGYKVGLHGAGAVVHPDERDYAPTPDGQAALAAYVRRWFPGLDPATADPISCTYATTEDENFVLDRRGPLTVAAGFSGHGFKFGPVLGRVLADLVEGREAPAMFALDSVRSAARGLSTGSR